MLYGGLSLPSIAVQAMAATTVTAQGNWWRLWLLLRRGCVWYDFRLDYFFDHFLPHHENQRAENKKHLERSIRAATENPRTIRSSGNKQSQIWGYLKFILILRQVLSLVTPK